MYLYGAGGHAKVVKEMLELNGEKVEAFVDDNPEVDSMKGVVVRHCADGLSPMIVAIGSNYDRKAVASRLDCRFGVAVHPSAIVSPSAVIGEGSVVMQGAVINADAVIGKHCIVNTGASVGHDCVLGDFCHVAPHATLCGSVHLGEGVWIGAGAVVIQNLTVGEWSVVGAGTVVIENVAGQAKVAGVRTCRLPDWCLMPCGVCLALMISALTMISCFPAAIR